MSNASVWGIDGDGAWDNAADWWTYVPLTNPPAGYQPWQHVLPGSDDDVSMTPTVEPSGASAGTSPFTVTYNTTATIHSLSAPTYATLKITGGVLTILSTSNFQGAINLSGGKLDVQNVGGVTFTIGGLGTNNLLLPSLDLTGGTLEVDAGSLVLVGANTLEGGVVSGAGDFYVSGFSSLAIDAGASITAATFELGVAPNGTPSSTTLNADFSYTGDFLLDQYTGNFANLYLNTHTLSLSGTSNFYGTVHGTGELLLKTGETASFSGYSAIGGVTIVNQGIVNLYNTLQLDGSLDNQSAATFDFTTDSGVTNSGSVAVTNEGTLEKTGGTGNTTLYGSFTSSGVVDVQTGRIAVNGSGGTLSGTIKGSGGFEIDYSGTYTLSSTLTLSVSGFYIDVNNGNGGGAAEVILGKSFSYGGTFGIGSNFSSTILDLAGFTLTLTGSATFDAPYGYVDVTGGGTLKIAQNATAAIDDTEIAGGVTVENAGTITDNGGFYLDTTAGASGGSAQSLLKNDATGVINIADVATAVSQDGTSGLITNAGKINKTAGTGTSNIYVVLNSTGTLEADTGTLYLHNGGMLGGTLAGAGAITLGGSVSYTLQSGLLLNVAYLNILNSATLTLGQNFTYSNTFYEGGTFSDTTLNLAGFTLTLAGSTTMTAAYGYVNLTGGGTLKIAQNSTPSIDSVQLAGGMTLENAGSITDYGNIYLDSTAGVSGGSGQSLLKNDTTGVINIVDVATAVSETGTSGLITNAGKIDKTLGTGVSDIFVVLNSTGTLEVDTGTLALHGGGSLGGALSGAGAIVLRGNVAYTLASGLQLNVASLSIYESPTVTLAQSFTYSKTFFEGGSFTNSTLNLAGFTFTLSGSATFTAAYGSVNMTGGGTLKIAQNATAAIDSIQVAGGVTLENAGTITDNGYIYMDSTAGASGGAAQSLFKNDATGVVNIGDIGTAFNQIGTSGLISNAGRIEKTTGTGQSDSYVALNSTGTLKVDSGTLAWHNGGTLGGTLSGAGTLKLAGGSFTTSGTTTNNGVLYLASGSLTVAGALAGTGTVEIGAGESVEFQQSVAAGQTIDFYGAAATAVVDAATSFHGVIAGFGVGDTIDFANIAYAASDYVSFVGNGSGAGGTVTIDNSSGAAIASFVVTGNDQPSQFKLSNDAGDLAVVGAAGLTRPTADDFNGDGVADILWRDPTAGSDTIWYLTPSGGRTAVNPGTVPASSEVAGVADFNHDGIADILWRNTTTGADSIWDMTPSGGHTTVNPGTVATSYEVAGVGDFNGDGVADILWRNTTTGADTIWYLTPSGGRTAVNIGTVPSSSVVAGIGDFNGDGIADILWRNTTTGADSIWDMNASGGHTTVNPGTVATSYVVAGIGDFNGDGIADILWRNTTTGADSIWDLTASGGRTVVNPGSLATNYQAAAIEDFNGDGIADILWRDPSTGADTIWDMTASGGHTAVNPGAVASNWKVAT